jgi:DNA transformation protein and related proteins
MAAASNEFVAHCLELLTPLGTVRTRRMFGGHGFYVDELFVALIASERLYLKTDALTRAVFEAEGCSPFAFGKAREGAVESVETSYFSAPEDAMESPPLMQPWARLALAAALRARATKPRAAKPVKKASPRKGASAKAPTKL